MGVGETHRGLGEVQKGASKISKLAADAARCEDAQQGVSQVGRPQLPTKAWQPLCSISCVHRQRAQAAKPTRT